MGLTIILFFFAACLVSILFPNTDLTVSGWFFKPGQGFFLQNQSVVVFLYQLVPVVQNVLALGLAIVFLSGLGNNRKRPSYRWRHASFYLLLALLIGPGLIVNLGFKDHWGRARPFQVQQFGGDKTYSSPLSPSDQCEHNCSFVSGHAALGFLFCAVAFVDPTRRRQWMTFGVLCGSVLGLARIVQGKHFLFDVIFCFFIVYASSWLIHVLLERFLPATLLDLKLKARWFSQ